VAVGSTLTCQPGAWTANATSFGFRWRVDVLNQNGDVAHLETTGPTYTAQGREIGQMFCLVDATSGAGTATAVAVAAVPTTPRLLAAQPQPRILGIETSMFQTAPLPAPGAVVTCQPPGYGEPGVTVTTRWTRTPSGGAAPVDLATGASLTLTADLLRAIAGQALGCTTSASIGGFFPDVRSSRDQPMAALYPPWLASVTISPDLYQNPPTAGTALTCTALNEAGPAEQTTYTWALQDTDPATSESASLDTDARILGHDPTYTMTQQDVDDFAGQYLVCRVEASSWQGTDAWWDWY
jgi:hypothetical protein